MSEYEANKVRALKEIAGDLHDIRVFLRAYLLYMGETAISGQQMAKKTAMGDLSHEEVAQLADRLGGAAQRLIDRVE